MAHVCLFKGVTHDRIKKSVQRVLLKTINNVTEAVLDTWSGHGHVIGTLKQEAAGLKVGQRVLITYHGDLAQIFIILPLKKENCEPGEYERHSCEHGEDCEDEEKCTEKYEYLPYNYFYVLPQAPYWKYIN